jgi:hypothetical protein
MKIHNHSQYMIAVAAAMYRQDAEALQEAFAASKSLGGSVEDQWARAQLLEVADAMIDLANKVDT